VEVPDKSQGAKMDQSINPFTQGQLSHLPLLFSHSSVPQLPVGR